MPKVIYEFDFYEDREILETFQRSVRYCLALDEIYNKIRTEFKHGSIEMDEKVERFLEEIQELAYVDS